MLAERRRRKTPVLAQTLGPPGTGVSESAGRLVRNDGRCDAIKDAGDRTGTAGGEPPTLRRNTRLVRCSLPESRGRAEDGGGLGASGGGAQGARTRPARLG